MGMAFKGHIEASEVLIEYGAEVNFSNAEGTTPLMMCAMFEQIELAKLLIASGADKAFADAQGKTAADHALAKGLPEEVIKQFE